MEPKSAGWMPEIVIGSDYSKWPIPGQQALELSAAGYREETEQQRALRILREGRYAESYPHV